MRIELHASALALFLSPWLTGVPAKAPPAAVNAFGGPGALDAAKGLELRGSGMREHAR
jgi:hypothetical protein